MLPGYEVGGNLRNFTLVKQRMLEYDGPVCSRTWG